MRQRRVDVVDLAVRFGSTGLTLPLALLVGLVAILGFWGVNIEDGGLILAQSHRILLGEIPHRDFISPRPAGSAFIHLVDFAVPLPLLLASKLVTLAELVVTGLCFSLFVFQKRLSEIPFVASCAVVIATLVGIEQFPIIPFYTIDGLTLLAVGFLLLQRGIAAERLWPITWAFAFFGVATTTKQSFWFAPIFALAVLLLELWRRGATRAAALRTCGAALAAAGVAPALYVAYVTLGGGWHEMHAELIGTRAVYGNELLAELREPARRAELVPSLLVLAVVLLLLARLNASKRPRHVLVDLVLRTVASGVVLQLVLAERLVTGGNWSQRVFWCVVVAAAARSLSARTVDVTGLTIAATAWMVTLSWGAPNPGLAAGACTVYLASAIWSDAALHTPTHRRLAASGAIGAALLVTVVFVDVRTRTDYGVLRGTETAALGGALRGVTMNAETAAYLRDVKTCVARHPARWTAVVPEGALAYPVDNLRSPFPIDWFWADDYRGADGRQRLVDAAATTDARGDYLVLFQTAVFGFPPPAPGRIAPFFSDPSLTDDLVTRLKHATRSRCGSFVAFYDPPREAP